MLNYLLNKNYKNYSKFKYNNNNNNINKKNSLSNIRQKKPNLNLVHPKNKKKSEIIETLNNNINAIKFTKKIINELFKREVSSEENKLKIKMHKTNTNSPIKKINFNRYPSYKRLTNNNDSFHLSLKNNKYNNYNNIINKSKINHNNSLSNNTTNFTNSINNTAVSVTNNNSYNISIKNNKKIKENQSQNQDIIKINLKILYKDIFYYVELDQFHDGLWLAKQINEYFDINLNDFQIKNLAQELTNQINNVINCIVNFYQEKNFGAVININKILESDKELIKEKKYKIVVKYNKEKYYFFINNNNDIIEMVDIIIYNIIKNEKYDCIALKNELIKKINMSFGISDYKNNFINDLNNQYKVIYGK